MDKNTPTGRKALSARPQDMDIIPSVSSPGRPDPREDAEDAIELDPEDRHVGSDQTPGWRPLAFAGALAATAVVAAVIGSIVTDALRPGVALGKSGASAATAEKLDAMATEIVTLQAVLDEATARLARLEGTTPEEAGGGQPYTPPRRADGDARSDSADPQTVASIDRPPAVIPPPPRAKPPVPATTMADTAPLLMSGPPGSTASSQSPDNGEQPFGLAGRSDPMPLSGNGQPFDLAARSVAQPPVSFDVPAPPPSQPSRFGVLGADREIAPRNSPPMPVGEVAEAPIIGGWTVIDAVDGHALIDGGFLGTFEVEPGTELPEIGMVQSVSWRDGWVVQTTRGLILSGPPPRF